MAAWRAGDLDGAFQSLGGAIRLQFREDDDWDNYRVQDPKIFLALELNRFVKAANTIGREVNSVESISSHKVGMSKVVRFFISKSYKRIS